MRFPVPGLFEKNWQHSRFLDSKAGFKSVFDETGNATVAGSIMMLKR
jgi:hypothetical protein